MAKIIEQYSEFWGDNPSSLLEEYNYHPELTSELDEMEIEELDRETLFKVVLWKVSRYPTFLIFCFKK